MNEIILKKTHKNAGQMARVIDPLIRILRDTSQEKAPEQKDIDELIMCIECFDSVVEMYNLYKEVDR